MAGELRREAMSSLLGVLFHFIGGFASGSFYLPFKRVRGWSWESYWIIGGVFSWLIAPWMAAVFTVPHFVDIIRTTPANILFWTYFMGLLWGVGGLTFGLSMRYLGLSLGMSVSLGFCAVFGALIPPVYRDILGLSGERFSSMAATNGGRLILLGVAVCLLGIAGCGWAGLLKERGVSESIKRRSILEFHLRKGLLVATASGVLSACFSFGIQAGQSMAIVATERGANPLFQNNVVYIVLLWGGLTTNLAWCMVLNARNHTFADYDNRSAPLARNYCLSALAGIIWFLQFFFYGMGASKLSNGASSWILHMAFIILISNVWGLILGEWVGVRRRTFAIVVGSVVTILISVLMVGYGTSTESP
jgi:L-rhamnose-H+ transport protein